MNNSAEKEGRQKNTKNGWLRIISESHSYEDLLLGDSRSRLDFLAGAVFGIYAYDSEKDEEFAARAVEVSRAISGRTTFDYIKDENQYRWFLALCHFPFFSNRIEWGTSLRGAWWDSHQGITFQSCSLFDGEFQMADEIYFDEDEWLSFISAVCDYAEVPHIERDSQ